MSLRRFIKIHRFYTQSFSPAWSKMKQWCMSLDLAVRYAIRDLDPRIRLQSGILQHGGPRVEKFHSTQV